MKQWFSDIVYQEAAGIVAKHNGVSLRVEKQIK